MNLDINYPRSAICDPTVNLVFLHHKKYIFKRIFHSTSYQSDLQYKKKTCLTECKVKPIKHPTETPQYADIVSLNIPARFEFRDYCDVTANLALHRQEQVNASEVTEPHWPLFRVCAVLRGGQDKVRNSAVNVTASIFKSVQLIRYIGSTPLQTQRHGHLHQVNKHLQRKNTSLHS